MANWGVNYFGFIVTPVNSGNRWINLAMIANTAPIGSTYLEVRYCVVEQWDYWNGWCYPSCLATVNTHLFWQLTVTEEAMFVYTAVVGALKTYWYYHLKIPKHIVWYLYCQIPKCCVSSWYFCWYIIIIIIIIIYCNWVVTRWQWLFYMQTKHEIGFISLYCFLSVQYLNYISVFQLIALN